MRAVIWRHPARGAARSDAQQVRDLYRHEIPEQRRGVSRRSASGTTCWLETKSALNRTDIVIAARSWLGTPYVHQASAKGAGCDCLGLIIGLYTELLGRAPEAPPPYTPDWNERRPCEEPLLNAARRHLVEVGDVNRHPVRNAARSDALQIRDLSLHEIPDQQRVISCRAASGMTQAFLPGQVLIFRVVPTGPAKHCGLVASDDTFIHAYAGRCVIESWLSRWWTERVAGVFDFPGAE